MGGASIPNGAHCPNACMVKEGEERDCEVVKYRYIAPLPVLSPANPQSIELLCIEQCYCNDVYDRLHPIVRITDRFNCDPGTCWDIGRSMCRTLLR